MATTRPDGMVERHYFGYVKVLVPSNFSKLSRVWSSDITSFGVRIQDGVGVGYFRDREIATPLDCRLVVFVTSKAELDQFVGLFERTKWSKDICAAIQESH